MQLVLLIMRRGRYDRVLKTAVARVAASLAVLEGSCFFCHFATFARPLKGPPVSVLATSALPLGLADVIRKKPKKKDISMMGF